MKNLLMRDKIYHFVGVGGIGMSGIALILLQMGFKVSGSDLRETDITRNLQGMGAVIYKGHRPENLKNADVLVISSAVLSDNPELLEAKKTNLLILHRAEMLAQIMNLKYGIAVAGAHGKTTTTSMIATVLRDNGLEPTVVVGGEINSLGANAIFGNTKYMVVEADESDCSFLTLNPNIIAVTNVDLDVNLGSEAFTGHNYDYDKIFDRIYMAFKDFINKIGPDGYAILCVDCSNVKSMLPYIDVPYVTYGLYGEGDFVPSDITLFHNTSKFNLSFRGENLGTFKLSVPGEHNIVNSIAAIAGGLKLGLHIEGIRNSLANFKGVKRRFQVIGEVNNIMVVDDYAHNPTKILNALTGIRKGWDKRRIVAVFQPHRYSRMKLLGHQLEKTFFHADLVVVTDIYSAGEEKINGINCEFLINIIKKNEPLKQVIFVPFGELKDWLMENSRSGDIVITLGAGNISEVARDFYNDLFVRDG